jgi:hypothetical protein
MNKYPRSGPDLNGERKVKEHNRNKGVLESQSFLKACERTGAIASLRQASKYKRHVGLAYNG